MMMGQTEEGVLEKLFHNLCVEPLFSPSAKNALYVFFNGKKTFRRQTCVPLPFAEC